MQEKRKDLYSATIKHFGSAPLPAFEAKEKQEQIWSRLWGCDNDVGQIRTVLMHRPGAEFEVIDRSKYIDETGTFGDLETGWYWQSDTIPDLAELQAQHDQLADTLRAEGVEVIYLDGVSDGRFKSIYTRDSCIAVKGGAICPASPPTEQFGVIA